MTGDLVDQFVETMAKEVASRVVAALRQETPAGSAREWRLLTVAEVSKRLGRSERWVREKAKAGQLPWIRLDAGPLAFRIEDLEQFAAERRVPAENDFQPITACPNPTSHNGSRGERRVSNPGVKS